MHATQTSSATAGGAAAMPILKSIGLRYVSDAMPGIRRRRAGKHFSYVGPDGAIVRDPGVLQRIRSLAIPPAYESVWISPIENGYLQATARDARGRKQYRYHPRWREVRDESKYERMAAFARALPRIRERVRHDLALPGLTREKVLATVVRLLETTHIRVGNEEYARRNGHYGLTTLRNRHVKVDGEHIAFAFVGKSGKKHRIDVRDRRLARIVARLRDLPGQELFQYEQEPGVRVSIGSADVNEYIREAAGDEFTAKDFRTWAGTVLAARELCDTGASETATAAKSAVVQAIKKVADHLGNTPSICRKCYVHPAVLSSYLDGSLLEAGRGRPSPEDGLDADEAFVLCLLESGAAPAVSALAA